MATSHQREQLAALMDWCYSHRSRIHYPPVHNHVIHRTESVGDIHSAEQIHSRVLDYNGWTVDCSQFCYALLGAVGLHPPHQDGATGSMLQDLPHYNDPRASYIGALAVFGPAPGHHVAMVRHRDTTHGNPVMCSQGQESDPRFINLLTEAQWQPHPVTMLSIAHLAV